MFGHPSQQQHMMSGVSKALKSKKTPPHLIPHLENRMKTVHGKPITGAKPQMTPKLPMLSEESPQIQSTVKAPPVPFKNPMGAANMPAPQNAKATLGLGATSNRIVKKPAKRGAFYGG